MRAVLQRLLLSAIVVFFCLSTARLTAAQGGSGCHIFYAEANDQIIHLYGSNGVWKYQNATVLTGATNVLHSD